MSRRGLSETIYEEINNSYRESSEYIKLLKSISQEEDGQAKVLAWLNTRLIPLKQNFGKQLEKLTVMSIPDPYDRSATSKTSLWVQYMGAKAYNEGKAIWDNLVELLNRYYYLQFLYRKFTQQDVFGIEEQYFSVYASQNVSVKLFLRFKSGNPNEGDTILFPPYIALFGENANGTFSLYEDGHNSLRDHIQNIISVIDHNRLPHNIILLGGIYFQNKPAHQILLYIHPATRIVYYLEPSFSGDMNVLNQQFFGAVDNFVKENFPGFTFKGLSPGNPEQCWNHQDLCTPLSVLGYIFGQSLTLQHTQDLLMQFLGEEYTSFDNYVAQTTPPDWFFAKYPDFKQQYGEILTGRVSSLPLHHVRGLSRAHYFGQNNLNKDIIYLKSL
jgi:hypothetical protein